MLKIDRILLPVAFSDNCRGTARYAAALACHFGSEVIMLHVVEPLGDALEFASGIDQMQKARRDWFTHELDCFFRAQLFGVSARKVLLEGDPASQIAGFAEAERVGLITMASRGHGRFRRLLLGSVTAKVLHDVGCPVWTGTHMEMGLAPDYISFGKVACAIDFGPQSDRVLEWAWGMASSWGASFCIVHNVSAHTDPFDLPRVEKDAREKVAARAAALSIANPEIVIHSDDSPHGICKSLERVNPDVLVIGRGHPPGHSGRLRSTAYAILRESPCPTVSI